MGVRSESFLETHMHHVSIEIEEKGAELPENLYHLSVSNGQISGMVNDANGTGSTKLKIISDIFMFIIFNRSYILVSHDV